MQLSASQEDYLEVILGLVAETGNARVRDIAERLGVARSSVTVALRSLAKRQMVKYEPYQLISLTNEGLRVGERIRRRHSSLSRFLQDVLDVDEAIAEANACRIEHAVTDGLVRRLSCFGAFMSASSVPARRLPRAFREYCEEQRRTGSCEGCKLAAERASEDPMQGEDKKMDTTLADLKPGEKAKIMRVGGAATANKRLTEMGLTRGAVLTVVRVAPLGDPVEVQVRGYNLSVRKNEAKAVEVERVK
ncbi:MAG TPA: MarR family transcriptional regulator [Phycisphaerales bacterium]|nr:MarR family transcriptional regulator [Phycisphaerales bacterium]